jgi:adenylate cyclase
VVRKKSAFKNILSTRSLQSYVLVEVLLLLILVLGVLSFFSKKQSEKDFQNFAVEYVDNFNRRTIIRIESEVKKVSQVPLYASKLLAPYIKKGAQSLPSNFKNPANQFLKEVLQDTPQLSSIYIGSKDGSFFQMRKVRDGSKYVLQENKTLPVVVSYSIRVIDRSKGQPATETFYYFDDHDQLVDSEVNLSPIYKPSQRPWYQDAVNKKDMFIGSIYTFGLTPHLVMTSSIPILNKQGNVKGVVASDFNIRDLSLMLDRAKLTKNTQAYLLARKAPADLNSNTTTPQPKIPNQDVEKAWIQDVLKLDVIATSEESPLRGFGTNARTISMTERRNTDLWKALENFYEEKEEAFVVNINNKLSVVNIMPLGEDFGKEWLLLSIVPYADLTALFFSSKEDMFSLYIFILFIACLQVILLARRIAYPIEDLREEAIKIKNFDLDGAVPINSKIKEVTALADTMKDMKVSLKSFTKYMPRQLVLNLLKNGNDINIGGQAKKLTMFFSDIAGFTTISEALAPDELMRHLSEYFDETTGILIQEKGTIDKYIGDAIMAFWGAPNEDDQQAYNACKSALLIQRKLAELNKRWAVRGLPILETRIGIHTGTAVVGNVGSSDRMNYTVIGDAVNLASRLEGINKYYDTYIIVSETTHEEIKDKFLCRTLDIVAVKGKTKGVRIYELVAEHNNKLLAADPAQADFIEKFEKGFDFYLNLIFAKALSLFKSLKNVFAPYDNLLNTYIERCENYVKNPPSDDWDGVYKLDKK